MSSMYGVQICEGSGVVINNGFVKDRFFVDLLTVSETGSKSYEISNGFRINAALIGVESKNKIGLWGNEVYIVDNTVKWKVNGGYGNVLTILVTLNAE